MATDKRSFPVTIVRTALWTACIRELRVTVWTFWICSPPDDGDEILADYPYLEKADFPPSMLRVSDWRSAVALKLLFDANLSPKLLAVL